MIKELPGVLVRDSIGMKITLQDLTKKFPSRDKRSRDEVTAVNGFDITLPDGKLIGLLGPSGCGKSTVRMSSGVSMGAATIALWQMGIERKIGSL